MVSFKYLHNVWRTIEMPLITWEISLILIWSDKYVLINDIKATAFAITKTKLYVPVVTLSTQDNAKLLQQFKSGFKRKKYQSNVAMRGPNPYLDQLIDPSFQEVNKIFVLSFENTADWTVHTKYYLPTVD